MTLREHARLARELITQCGGLAEASIACGTSKTVLSTYQNPAETSTMAARVMADLEQYCGQPTYSSALAGRFDQAKPQGDLRTAACEFAEISSDLQRRVRLAQADGAISPNELDEIAAAEREAEAALDRLRAIRLQHEQAATGPRLHAV